MFDAGCLAHASDNLIACCMTPAVLRSSSEAPHLYQEGCIEDVQGLVATHVWYVMGGGVFVPSHATPAALRSLASRNRAEFAGRRDLGLM